MRTQWLERLLETVADRGRDLLHIQTDKGDGDPMETWCRKLLDGRGEASAIALARDVLREYAAMSDDERAVFFELLYSRFGPSVEGIRSASEEFLNTRHDDALLRLIQAVEPPRQELFRRLNMAPYGTRALVHMRSDLLRLTRGRPHLNIVDADLKHLLGSWFNRGFLRLERIEWSSPAQILEKLIEYESVHAIQGWDDLRRRLARDRRCYAFFHPALPDEPLIFVEVALVNGIAGAISPLIDQNSAIENPDDANTAIFYSINNTQRGLRGISFGNFLIKQVLTDLQQEFPSVAAFATLSPLPRLATALQGVVTGRGHGEFDLDLVHKILRGFSESVVGASGSTDVLHVFLETLEKRDLQQVKKMQPAISLIVLAYLTKAHGPDGGLLDPVAEFHLANGAIVESINPLGDVSERGLKQSYGCMVNYRYDPDTVVANHERFVNAGVIAMSKILTKDYQKIKSLLDKAA